MASIHLVYLFKENNCCNTSVGTTAYNTCRHTSHRYCTDVTQQSVSLSHTWWLFVIKEWLVYQALPSRLTNEFKPTHFLSAWHTTDIPDIRARCLGMPTENTSSVTIIAKLPTGAVYGYITCRVTTIATIKKVIHPAAWIACPLQSATFQIIQRLR